MELQEHQNQASVTGNQVVRRRDVEKNTEEKTLEEMLDKIPVGWFHYRLLLICGLAFMADGMEVSLLSFMSICAGADWDLSDTQMALITSVVFLGQLVGSAVFGPVADDYGRHKAFAISSILISVGGVLSGVAPNVLWLIFLRGLVGFGVGGIFVPYDLLAEFLPNSHRGIFLIYVEVFWTIGSMFVAGVAWACLSTAGWRVLALITAIPVVLATIGCILLLPESPRWLIVKGRLEDAKKVLQDAAAVNGQTLDDFTLSADIVAEKHASILDFLHPDQRNISIPLWIIWMCFGFSYYGVILFIGRLFETNTDPNELVCHFNYRPIFVSAMSEVFGVVLTGVLIDAWGRVPTQASLYGASAVGIVLMGVGLPDMPLVVVSMCARLCMMGASSATWVITPELFKTELRASGHAISNCMARLGAFLVPFLVSSHKVSVSVVSLCLAISCVIGCLCAMVLPETSNKNMDDESINPSRIQRIIDRANNKTIVSATDSVNSQHGSDASEQSEEHDRVRLNKK